MRPVSTRKRKSQGDCFLLARSNFPGAKAKRSGSRAFHLGIYNSEGMSLFEATGAGLVREDRLKLGRTDLAVNLRRRQHEGLEG